jgi:hypothetical protein
VGCACKTPMLGNAAFGQASAERLSLSAKSSRISDVRASLRGDDAGLS